MDEDVRQFEIKHFVEEVGLFFEQLGLTRMAGRVMGWLLICDPPHQSMGELVDALLASKASISNTTRLLIQIGFIERISLPGERRDYFRIKPDAFFEVTKAEMFKMRALRQLTDRGLTLLDAQDPSLKMRLDGMREMCLFFEENLPPLLEAWEQKRKHLNDYEAVRR
ncbi:MAG: MarR family transcriptional regulator [Chloroflexota bacterium]